MKILESFQGNVSIFGGFKCLSRQETGPGRERGREREREGERGGRGGRKGEGEREREKAICRALCQKVCRKTCIDVTDPFEYVAIYTAYTYAPRTIRARLNRMRSHADCDETLVNETCMRVPVTAA